MGEPFPFPDEPGDECARCKLLFPDQITPKYLYAKIDDVVLCPGVPPGLPDINGVHRLTQDALVPCSYFLFIDTPVGILEYALEWLVGFSVFHVAILPFFDFFVHSVVAQCWTLFVNQIDCDLTPAAAASGGTAEIFWGP